MENQRIIDAHGHVKWHCHDAADLVANMDEHGIERAWLLTCEMPPEERAPGGRAACWPGNVGMPIKDVLEAVRAYPDRFVPFYAPDPRRPDCLARLRDAVKHNGVRGFGEMKVRVMLDDPRALVVFHYCGENGLPVVFHMDVPLSRNDLGRDPGYWYCYGWENLARALERCPNTTFLGHAPGFWAAISGDAHETDETYPSGPVTPGGLVWEFLDRYPNLYCDLSANSGLNALQRDPEVGRRFLTKYRDRCLFGRDCFDDRLHRFLLELNLPQDVLGNILCENALRLVPAD